MPDQIVAVVQQPPSGSYQLPPPTILVPAGYEPAPPAPLPGGWAGVARVMLSMRHDQVVIWALIGTLGYLLWQGPAIVKDVAAQSLRVQQEESERNRQANADRDGRDRSINEQRDQRFLEMYKVEFERNRQANGDQVKLLLTTTTKLSQDIGKLDATNQRLEQRITELTAAVSALSKKVKESPPDDSPGRIQRATPPPGSGGG